MAKPFWDDENYQRSVILVIEHNRSGSIGLIINKESNLDVHLALDDLNLSQPLYFGGPFHKHTIFFLHSEPDIPGCIYVGKGLFVGGEYDFLKNLINSRKMDVNKVRFCAGYVVWKGGQLENEMKEDRWWASDVDAKQFFDNNAETLWSDKLMADGHIYGIFEDYPDPSLS